MRLLSRQPGEAVQGRQARQGLGFHEGHAHLSHAAHGDDGRHERMRGLPQDRDQDRGGRQGTEKAEGGPVRGCLLRFLPHPPHLLQKGGPAAAGLPDLPHGHRSPPVGDVLLLQARGALPAEAKRRAARECRGAYLPELPHVRRQPRCANGLGVCGRQAPAARGQEVGRRPNDAFQGSGRPRSLGQGDGPPRRAQGPRRLPYDPGGLAEGARPDV